MLLPRSALRQQGVWAPRRCISHRLRGVPLKSHCRGHRRSLRLTQWILMLAVGVVAVAVAVVAVAEVAVAAEVLRCRP